MDLGDATETTTVETIQMKRTAGRMPPLSKIKNPQSLSLLVTLTSTRAPRAASRAAGSVMGAATAATSQMSRTARVTRAWRTSFSASAIAGASVDRGGVTETTTVKTNLTKQIVQPVNLQDLPRSKEVDGRSILRST